MLQSLEVSYRAIVPMFIIIAVGFCVRLAGLITAPEVKRLNAVVFRTFIPVMVFYSIYHANFSSLLRPGYALFACGGIIFTTVLAILIVLPIEKTAPKRASMIHAALRSNFLLIGVSLVSMLQPDGDISLVSVLSSLTIPLYTVLAVFILEYFRGGSMNLVNIGKSMIKNPLIIATLLGFAMQLLKIQLPYVVDNAVSKLNTAASPVALMVLGMSLEWQAIAADKKDIAVTIFLRLVLFPAIILSLAMLIGIRGTEFVVLIPLFASPCAVNSFNMSQAMGGDVNIAGGALVISTILSFITLFGWITLFSYLGMF